MARTKSSTLSAVTVILLMSSCCRVVSLLAVNPENQNLFAPEMHSITCNFGAPCTAVSWTGPTPNLRQNPRVSIDDQDRRSILTIHNVSEEDEGTFSCICNVNPQDRVNSVRISNLRVDHHPNVDRVNRNQTFHRGEAIIVECDSDRGDPALPLTWLKNENVLGNSSHNRVRVIGNHVAISGIQDSDAGIYTCAYFETPGEPIRADIRVNVIDRPPNPPDPILQDVQVRYNESQDLSVWCDANLDDQSLQYSWIVRNERTIPGPHLFIPHGQVLPGFYHCKITRGSEQFSHAMFVDVIYTPPVIDVTEDEASSTELQPLNLPISSMYTLETSKLTYQWEKVGRNKRISFADRVEYSISDKRLNVVIREARLDDRGDYILNISNKYGSDELRVTLNVKRLKRTLIQATFQHLPCDQIQANRTKILNKIADAFECGSCGNVHPDPDSLTLTPSCRTDRDSGQRTVSMNLLSQDDLPPITAEQLERELNLEGFSLEPTQVCLEQCDTPTTPPEITLKYEGTSESVIVASVVVAGAITIFVLLLVLFFAFLIWRCRNHYSPCNKYRVGQQEVQHPRDIEEGREVNDPHPDVVQPASPANQNQVECTGYVSVTHPTSHVTQGGVGTPVTIPYHLVSPSSDSRSKRPGRLYIRSHSYHAGTTRTPPA